MGHDVMAKPMMRCLYEVLGVEKDADEAAIRKAYRKGALAWHPGEWLHCPLWCLCGEHEAT